MAGATSKTRISPPLMYAFREAHAARDATKQLDLRDEAGERIIAGRRAAPRVAITEARLRREVAQDLETLLNTVNLASARALGEVPLVARSVLNFGIPDLVHRSIDEASVGDVGHEIAAALARYEPRLARDSIEVERDVSVDKTALSVRFLVRADLLCEPLPVPVEFLAELELDTGKVAVNQR